MSKWIEDPAAAFSIRISQKKHVEYQEKLLFKRVFLVEIIRITDGKVVSSILKRYWTLAGAVRTAQRIRQQAAEGVVYV